MQLLRYMMVVTLALTLLVTVGCGEPEAEGTIRIGQITNRTGATSDIGVPLANGVRDAWAWINANGGVRGRPVRVIERECGYDTSRTVSAFEGLTRDMGVPLIHGFGTPDSEAVMEMANRQQIVYLPTSYDQKFVNAEAAPYFFITTTDYSTAGRSAVRYVAEQGGKLGLARAAGGFGQSAIPAIKDEAQRLGVEIVSEQDVDYNPTSTAQQAIALHNAGATHIWMGNTHTAMSLLARDLRRQGSDAKIIGNIYAGDENFINSAGNAAEGHLTIFGSVTFGDMDAEVMQAIIDADRPDSEKTTHYIRGWAQALLVREVLERAIDQGLELNGENLRQVFYTIDGFTAGGLIPPISYSPQDHRPSTTAPIYEVREGQWVKIWEYESAE